MHIESYNPFILVASVVIGIISSYTALILIERIYDANKPNKNAWIATGAFVIGLGTFLVHFVGMLASDMISGVIYNMYLLLASLVVSVLSYFWAFHTLFVRPMKRIKIVLSGAGLGAGMVLTHFLALAAGINISELAYRPSYLILSGVIALCFSATALLLFFKVKQSHTSLKQKAAGGLVLGITISLMHYTGMEAVAAPPLQNQLPAGLSAAAIAVIVSVIACMMMSVSVCLAFIDFRASKAERKLLKKVKESEKQYRHLIELSPEAVVVQNEKEIVFINEAGVRLAGASDKREVMGKSILDYIHPSFKDMVEEAMQNKQRGMVTKPMELQVIDQNGAVVEIEATGVRMEMNGENVTQFIIRNVTGEKRIKRELEENRQYYQSLFEHNPDGIFSMDHHGKLVHTNKELKKMVGYSSDELSQLTFHPLVSANDLDRTAEKFMKTLQGEPQSDEIKVVHKNGQEIHVWVKCIPIFIDRKITGVYGIVKDISKEKEATLLLEDNEQKYRALFEYNLDAAFELDTKGFFRNVNQKAEELTCFSKEELRHMSFTSLNIKEIKEMKKAFSAAIKGEAVHTEVKAYNCTDRLIEVDLIVMPIRKQGKVDGVFVLARDVTEKKQAQQKIQEMAYTDQLTLLPNRHWLYQNLKEILKKAEDNGQTVAVMIIDFDNFKGINDLLGHQGGDLFLREMSQRIKNHLLPGDAIARLGGDEFVIVLKDVTKEQASMLAGNIVKEASLPVSLLRHEVMATTSIGVSMQSKGETSKELLISQADLALYAAKKNGKNTFCFFTEELSEEVTREAQLQNSLRKAVEENEFELHYQPQVDLLTGEMTGLEALIRWNSPFGPVSPSEFIPLAEKSCLITSIGEWVIEAACRQMKIWEEKGFPKIKVAVNVSAKQFKDAYLSEKVMEIIKNSGIDPAFFEIEITESVMLDVEETEQIIKKMKRFGIKIAIDDFGTGYSSLNVIKNIEIDTLKVDKSLIDEVIDTPRNLALLSTIINIGENLGTKIVLEGIERQDQLDMLKKFGVFGQGYFFSRPLPAEQLEQNWIEVGSTVNG